MTQSQSRPRTPANWHPAAQEREGLWILTRLRDFVDDIANTSPARLALTVFAAVCLLFTLLLSLPASSADGSVTPLHQAMFTAVSAVCVTGLTVVDTATHFTGAGQLWLLLFIQLGGLGLISLTTLLVAVLKSSQLSSLFMAAMSAADYRKDASRPEWK